MVINHQKFNYRENTLIEQVTVKPPFRFGTNFPDEACFIYFEDMNMRLYSPHDQVDISPNDSVLLKCGTYFADLKENLEKEIYKITVFHLPINVLRDIYIHDFPPIKKQASALTTIQKIENNTLVREFIKGLYFYFENPGIVSDELLALKTKELILLLIQTENATSVNALLKKLFTPQQIDLQEVVNSHLFSDIAVDDLALLCNMSVSTFKRQFKSVFNDSPASYMMKKRLERAKKLLSLQGNSIGEIAYKTGFNDVAHFSNAFKAIYKISPSDWRKSNN